MLGLWPTLLVFDALGWWLGLRMLWRAAPTPWPLLDLTRAAALGSGGVVAGCVVGFLGLGSFFAALHFVAHAVFFVLAPLGVLRGLWWLGRRAPRRRPVFGVTLLLLGLTGIALYAYATCVEARALETTHHAITTPRLQGLKKPVRVVVLADLQTDAVGDYEREVFARIDALAPDVLLLAGDYLQLGDPETYAEQMLKLQALCRARKHKARLGTYAVLGNTDPTPVLFEDTDVRLLRDEFVQLEGVPLRVFGISYPQSNNPLSASVRQEIAEYPGLTLVMGHRPDFMLEATRSGEDLAYLAIAGHTHGGQIVVPSLGPLMTMTRVPRHIAAGGLHRVGEAWFCVSRGVGLERHGAPPVRLFCPPELVVFELGPE